MIQRFSHYIDENWKLQKRILCFCNVQGRHTGENVGNVVLKKLYEWNLDRKVLAITLDNAKSNDGVVREIISKLQPKWDLLLNGSLLQVRCCAYILNLVVQYGLRSIILELEKVRATIKFFRGSPQRQQKFEHDCKQIGLPSKRFVQYVCTRWNSTYMMLKIALELKNGLICYEESEPDFKCCPSKVDWGNAQVVADCLNVFYEETNVLSGSAYTTINRYFDLFCPIYLHIMECKYEEEVCAILENYKCYLCLIIYIGFESYLEESVEAVHVKSDLELYLEDPTHQTGKGKGLDDQGFDILSWWKYSSPKYPIMGMLARDILAIPATSVASESAFTTGGRVVNRYRSTMRSHTIEGLICARDWIRKRHQDGRVLRDEYALETLDTSIDELEILEDCGDIVEPEVTNADNVPILDIWDLDDEE